MENGEPSKLKDEKLYKSVLMCGGKNTKCLLPRLENLLGRAKENSGKI